MEKMITIIPNTSFFPKIFKLCKKIKTVNSFINNECLTSRLDRYHLLMTYKYTDYRLLFVAIKLNINNQILYYSLIITVAKLNICQFSTKRSTLLSYFTRSKQGCLTYNSFTTIRKTSTPLCFLQF